MIRVESDRPAKAFKSLASEVLGYQVDVSPSVRLGNEIQVDDGTDDAVFTQLLRVLSADGHQTAFTKVRPVKRARSVKVEDELWNAATAKAEQHGEYLSEIIRAALERYVKRA